MKQKENVMVLFGCTTKYDFPLFFVLQMHSMTDMFDALYAAKIFNAIYQQSDCSVL